MNRHTTSLFTNSASDTSEKLNGRTRRKIRMQRRTRSAPARCAGRFCRTWNGAGVEAEEGQEKYRKWGGPLGRYIKGGIRYLPVSYPCYMPDPACRLRQGRGRRCRHRSRCKDGHVFRTFFPTCRVRGMECPGGIPGNAPPPSTPRLRSIVRWRRAVLHILYCPPRPPRSGRFLRLQEYFGISGRNLQEAILRTATEMRERTSADFHPTFTVPRTLPARVREVPHRPPLHFSDRVPQGTLGVNPILGEGG